MRIPPSSLLFPRPRGRIAWASIAPLVVFLILFGGALLYIELAHPLIFTSPGWLWLFLLSPWFWWQFATGMSGLRGTRAFAAQLVRLLIFGLLLMALAGPRAVRENDSLSIIYLVDVSDSMGGSGVKNAIKFVNKTVQKRSGKDKAGLVVFARDAAVELPPRQAFPLESINSVVGKDATNIAKGLSLAAAMVPQGENGRIVLITDGATNEGILKEALNGLRSKRIPVDALPLEYSYDQEVWLERIDLPVRVKKGETYEAAVLLSSLKPGTGLLTLEENGNRIFAQNVSYKAGRNRFSIPLRMRTPGYYEYVAKIFPGDHADGWTQNNIAIGGLYLRGQGKILLVKDSYGDPRDWQPLLDALRRNDFVVETMDAAEFPSTGMALMPYDCVIFDNVPADAFFGAQFNALKIAVENQGVGFLMVGGANSFGPGGYNRTSIEEILPVNMDITNKKVLPKGALVIILHTCEFPDGNTWAKRIAKAAIRVLGAKDEVGLIAYDYQKGEKWIFPLTPASQYSKLVKKINRAAPGDMPTFANTMNMGLKGLKASNAAAKHMIIISDGDPSPPPPALINKFKKAKISISTVLVDGYHQGGYQRAMRAIAGSTGGRFYYPKNPRQLPRIFVKEAKTIKRSMVQNQTFVPRVEFDDGALLKEISAFPPLHGYVLTSAKDDPRRCRVVLRGPDKDQLDPVLAVGQFGVGRTAAFTSDLAPNWAKDWYEWNKFLPFIKQLVVSISRISKASSLRLRAFASGNNGVLIMEDFHPHPGFLDAGAIIAGPGGRSVELKFKQDAPGRYSATFPLWGKGRYEIVAVASGDGRDERTSAALAVPYSAEYLRFRSNPKLIKEIVQRTSGRLLTGNETGKEIFTKDRETRRISKPIFDLFLLLIACCIPLDVGIRRIQIDFGAIIAFFRRKRGSGEESTQTLGALLKRKESVETQIESTRTTVSIPPSAPPSSQEKSKRTTSTPIVSKTKTDSAKTAEPTPTNDGPKSDEENGSDTDSHSVGRLLAAKRRKKGGK